MSNPILAVRSALYASLIEREAEIDALMLALVANEHVLYVGPPGCAKTFMVNHLATAMQCKFFGYQLNRNTTPDDLFGQIDMETFGRTHAWQRHHTNTMFEGDLVYIDETFNGSSATLNCLLGAMQEGVVTDFGKIHKLPLRCLIGSSNLYPGEDHKDCAALFDRFAIRRTVRYVSPQNEEQLLFGTFPPVPPLCTLADLDAAHATAKALPYSADAKAGLLQICQELRTAGINPSDRRRRKAVGIAKAAAFLDGASEVQLHHLEPLGDVLWDDPTEHPEKCATIVSKIANPVGARLTEIIRDCDEITRNIGEDTGKAMAAIKKIQDCEKEVNRIIATGGNGRAKKTAAYLLRERARVFAKATGASFESALAAAK